MACLRGGGQPAYNTSARKREKERERDKMGCGWERKGRQKRGRIRVILCILGGCGCSAASLDLCSLFLCPCQELLPGCTLQEWWARLLSLHQDLFAVPLTVNYLLLRMQKTSKTAAAAGRDGMKMRGSHFRACRRRFIRCRIPSSFCSQESRRGGIKDAGKMCVHDFMCQWLYVWEGVFILSASKQQSVWRFFLFWRY